MTRRDGNRRGRVLLALAGAALATSALAAETASAVKTCNGQVATIVRGSGDNNITATGDPDVIVAGKGDDVVNALEGGDTVCGGGGNDSISGNQGSDDYLAGGRGRDRVYGDTFGSPGVDGNDYITGGRARDGGTAKFRGNENALHVGLFGGGGNDQIQGGDDNDQLFGDAGDDSLTGDAGVDKCDGGSGNADTADCETVTGVP